MFDWADRKRNFGLAAEWNFARSSRLRSATSDVARATSLTGACQSPVMKPLNTRIIAVHRLSHHRRHPAQPTHDAAEDEKDGGPPSLAVGRCWTVKSIFTSGWFLELARRNADGRSARRPRHGAQLLRGQFRCLYRAPLPEVHGRDTAPPTGSVGVHRTEVTLLQRNRASLPVLWRTVPTRK